MKKFITTLVLLLASVSSSFADRLGVPEIEPQSGAPSSPVPEAETKAPIVPESPEQGNLMLTYTQPTFANIARVYWKLGVYSLLDDDAMDQFLMTSECDLYERFHGNEFEWRKIKEATRGYIEKYKDSFSRKFEYVQPLFLDRYDFGLRGFPLMPEWVYIPTTRLEINAILDQGYTCGTHPLEKLPAFPRSVVVAAKQPFQLKFIRVEENLAKEYLREIEKRNVDLTQGRPAYIRFRMRLDAFIGIKGQGNNLRSEFSGVIETVEVFGDKQLTFKLYEQTIY